jgi:hypothetical protein
MTDAERFLSWLYDFGSAATLNIVTGTACPCMVSRDSTKSEYSPEWHRNNPTALVCSGTGVITTTTTTTNIKAIIHPPGVMFNSIYAPKETLVPIGELQKDDMLFWGSVNTSTGAFVDLSGKNENKDYVTFNSINYALRDVSDVFWAGVRIMQAGALIRKRA